MCTDILTFEYRYHSLKQNQKSASLFEALIQEDPDNFEATISLAHVYRDMSLSERARDL
jgi:lipopolysaccharide biosynthesis regulator YciM